MNKIQAILYKVELIIDSDSLAQLMYSTDHLHS